MYWFWDNVHLEKEDRTALFLFVLLVLVFLFAKWYMMVCYHPMNKKCIVDLNTLDYVMIDTLVQESNGSNYQAQTKPHFVSTKSTRSTKSIKPRKRSSKSSPSLSQTKPHPLFSFDPNELSKDSLRLLGIGKYATENIIKYRSKGGRFFKPEDLKKVYGMDSILAMRLMDSIQINIQRNENWKDKPSYDVPKFKKKVLALNSIDVNQADTTQFKSLKGIGPVYANRIVKFRNSLGGYFTIEQLRDVWGISDSLFTQIRPYLTIDTSKVKRKNINDLKKENLVKHPYIDWKKAKVICSYRKMHGKFKSMEEFEKLHGLEDAFVDTLKQYFVVE